MPRHTSSPVRAGALLLLLHACGGSQASVKPLEFTPRHAVLFDDGVDLIEDPDALQGRWKSDWDQELDERMAHADFVSSGMVKTIRVEVDPEGRATYHLMFEVSRDLKGDAPRDQISLASREGAAGYSSLEQHRDRILNRGLVAFVRKAKDASGAIVAHFHLMPPSAAISRSMDRQQKGHRGKQIQVIEHHQE